jgi:DNA helicase-2/ATP-dependent DNA helicase PcrA
MVIAEALLDPLVVPRRATRAQLPTRDAGELLRRLNREQRRAVTHDRGPALVIAGPGTGKTEVVTRRVAWLIATRRARPREILALTFTDNAALEMQARVDVLVPYGQADAAIHTFHAFGDRLLHEHAFELGLSATLRLVTRAEQIVFLREHIFELGLERYAPLGDPTRFLGALVDLFGRAKDEDLTPDQLIGAAAALRAEAQTLAEPDRTATLDLADSRAELGVAFEAYQRLVSAASLIDHSDQVSKVLELLRTRPHVRADIAHRYRYILVDELQDTNRTQIELVLALGGANGNVMAVGDPAQGIYGFRGARTGNIERFRAAHDRIATITLRRNYRSLAPIVEAARRVATAGADVVADGAAQVAHRRGRGVPLRHETYSTPESEADAVADSIAEHIRAGAHARDFAVLLRSNSETDEFVRALQVRGVDVDSATRARLLDVPAVRALLAYLRLVADPSNSLEAFALAAAKPYEVDAPTLTRLLNGSRRRNRSLLEALGDALTHADPSVSQEALKRAARLIEHVDAGVAMASTHASGEVLYDYLRRSGALARLARPDESAAIEARSVARFCELVRARAALLSHDRLCNLVPALDIDAVEDATEPDAEQRDAVRVMTVHRAKGLEFANVYISGLVDGRFPTRARPSGLALPGELLEADAVGDGVQIAEERRLFYVALTRARDSVVLTSHEFGPRGRGRRRPSQFIAEAIDAPVAAVSASNDAQLDPESLARLLVGPVARPEVRDQPDRSLTLSFSQIDEFLTCPERYRLRYDIGIPTPAHHALSYGTAIHQAIAAFHSSQARGVTLTDDELVAELRKAWQPDGFVSREHEDARFAAGAQALKRFRTQQIAAGGIAPAAIERTFSFRLGRDEIRGRIDRIDAAGNGTVITDYKSSDVRDQKRADTKARDSLQLQVYALAHQAETGGLPARVQLHFVESGVVGSAAPTAERLDKARVKLIAAADAIRARKFDPKPSAIACGYCPFRTICSSSAA